MAQIHILLECSDFQGAVELTDVKGAFEVLSEAMGVGQKRQERNPGFEIKVLTIDLNKELD